MSLLELQLSSGSKPGTYTVSVVRSDAGEALGQMTLDVDALAARHRDWERAILASTTSTRRSLSDTEEPIRKLGEELFAAVFASPSVASRYQACLAVASERGEPLRIAIRLDAPELVPVPWEALFDSGLGSYVSRREPIVRRVAVASAPAQLTVSPPLRILGITASPRGLPRLDLDAEKERVESALKAHTQAGRIALEWLNNATWSAIQQILMEGSWHVVHFIGHGDFDTSRDEGVICLVDEDGRANHVNADRFADLLREASPMPRLVVLNSCEGATSGGVDLFAGTAAALVRGGVTAVAAMQFAITDKGAVAFAQGFYTALAQGRGVDSALKSGRVAILGTSEDSLEWVTPVLYLRGDNTQLFRFTSHMPKDVEDKPRTISADTGPPKNEEERSVPQTGKPADTAAHSERDSPWHAEVTFEWTGRVSTETSIALHLSAPHVVVYRSALRDRFTVDGSVIFEKVLWGGTQRLDFVVEDAGVPRAVHLELRQSLLGEYSGYMRPRRIRVDSQDVTFHEGPATPIST